jgi:hypothetical protein
MTPEPTASPPVSVAQSWWALPLWSASERNGHVVMLDTAGLADESRGNQIRTFTSATEMVGRVPPDWLVRVTQVSVDTDFALAANCRNGRVAHITYQLLRADSGAPAGPPSESVGHGCLDRAGSQNETDITAVKEASKKLMTDVFNSLKTTY